MCGELNEMPLGLNPATVLSGQKTTVIKNKKGQIVGYLSSVLPVLSHRSHWVHFCVAGSKGYLLSSAKRVSS